MKKLFILFALLTLASCSGGKNSTGFNIIDDMMYSEAYEAYTDNIHFKNGQTMQLPQEGTIARGFLPYHYAQADGEKAGNELQNPYEVNEAFLERGKLLYYNTCMPCHGESGKGDGLVIQKGVPQPPSYTSRRVRKYKVGQIYHVITVGYGNMASHSQQLNAEDRWAVAEYVKRKLIKR